MDCDNESIRTETTQSTLPPSIGMSPRQRKARELQAHPNVIFPCVSSADHWKQNSPQRECGSPLPQRQASPMSPPPEGCRPLTSGHEYGSFASVNRPSSPATPGKDPRFPLSSSPITSYHDAMLRPREAHPAPVQARVLREFERLSVPEIVPVPGALQIVFVMAEQKQPGVSMKFCPECNFMLYPHEDKVRHKLGYQCKQCGHTEPATESCVGITRVLASSEREYVQVSHDLSLDPTLPRTNNVPCPRCGHDEAAFTQSNTSRGDEGISLLFICTNPQCGYQWLE
ncbi:putative DNA-directed RNA polymerases II; IV and V subunit 9B [Paratrimastix pyriformis]|uniref:DNA-directed RNA polymerases II n=1 Tax=Paratrimastix pyriformis TaxID=342808 RepID=A0ABQ8U362_9EUKA|nr:putative DNA-directed RNA polymerases II; IV and V subunit 9B [Paratrimastix pyriformis]